MQVWKGLQDATEAKPACRDRTQLPKHSTSSSYFSILKNTSGSRSTVSQQNLALQLVMQEHSFLFFSCPISKCFRTFPPAAERNMLPGRHWFSPLSPCGY